MFKRNGKKLLRRSSRQQQAKRMAQPVLKSPREIQLMREAGRIVARVHEAFREVIEPGVSTWDLDQLALGIIQKYNAESCFLGYGTPSFPAHICTSINEELVHGIPSKSRQLKDGDTISIDVGVRHRGFIGDSAWSYKVGEVSDEASKLMSVTEESLMKGIEKAQAGNRIIDVSRAIQQHVEANGFHIVREYTGHGVGRNMHEAPQVLNYVSQDADGQLVMEPGLVIAIEPMVQVGTWQTTSLSDKWTVISRDHSLATHFEHTVAITNSGPQILTLL